MIEQPLYPQHDEDFYGWAMANAKLLRERKMDKIDFENLIEEIESMGRSEKHQLINRLAVLLAHLLKWQYQPELRGRSWRGTIVELRKRVNKLIEENPSLRAKIPQSFVDSYDLAISLIEKETPIDLSLLTKECPYSFDQCLDSEFYPE